MTPVTHTQPRTDTAVILAAGRGSRLDGHTRRWPKCLLEVGGRTLLERQVSLLHEVGVREVVVVVGYGAEHVRAHLNGRCTYVHNDRYRETNSLYSLWLARRRVRGSMVLLNCDVVAHPEVLRRVVTCGTSALAYDASSGADPEHMKVCLSGEYVAELGKDLPAERTHGENVGVLRFDQEAAQALFAAAGEAVAEGHERTWAPAAVSRIARRVPIRAIEVGALPWCEIDFPEDLAHARERIAPAIDGRPDKALSPAPALATPSAPRRAAGA